MTFKDKPQRGGAKRPGSDKKQGERSFKSGPRDGERPAKAYSAKPKAEGAAPASDKAERISKLIARAGVASRRDVERMIMEGRVKLNGKVLETPVVNATLADRIEVDDMPIRGIERTRLWLYHKPAGLVTTNADPEGRPTVFDNLPEGLPRVMSVGRLDINTEGLLLLTNDGGLARVLELPATGWLRRYRVRAHGAIDQAALDKLKDGIAVDGVLYGGIEATLDRTQGHNVWITMGLREGKNREIKNVLGAIGLEVNRLIRISYGPFQLADLPEAQALEVRGKTLRDQLGPRLIADSNANFEAPIYETEKADDKEEAAPSGWQADRGDKARNDAPRGERTYREKPGDRREKALGRLDTRREERGDKFGDKRFGGDRDQKFGGDREKRSAPAPRPRTSNVWMAPGARPVAEKVAKEGGDTATEKRTPRARPAGAPESKRYGRTKDGQPTRTTSKHDPDRKSGGNRPMAARGTDTGPRVLVNRAEEDRDWIRAEAPAPRSRDEGDAPRRGRDSGDRKPRDFGDRPPRGDFGDRKPRAFGDRKPRDFGDRPPRGERPSGDGERPARSFRSDRPEGGDRPFRSDKPFKSREGAGGAKPFGSKPGGGKSFGGKPGGGKSFGGKPSGGNPGGGKPRSDRPSGGDRPFGGKPGGGRGNGGGKGVNRGADRRR